MKTETTVMKSKALFSDDGEHRPNAGEKREQQIVGHAIGQRAAIASGVTADDPPRKRIVPKHECVVDQRQYPRDPATHDSTVNEFRHPARHFRAARRDTPTRLTKRSHACYGDTRSKNRMA